MSEAFVIAPIGDTDAVAVRSGDDVLVHLSPAIPRWAMPTVVDHLQRTVRAVDGQAATASLQRGEAMSLVADCDMPGSGFPLSRRATVAVVAVTAGVAPCFISSDTLHFFDETLPALIEDHWAPDNYGLNAPLYQDTSDHLMHWPMELI